MEFDLFCDANSTYNCLLALIKMNFILPDHMLVSSYPSPLALVPLLRYVCWWSWNRDLDRPLKIPQIHLNGGHTIS